MTILNSCTTRLSKEILVLAKGSGIFSLGGVVEFGFRAFRILSGQSEETLITVFFCF